MIHVLKCVSLAALLLSSAGFCVVVFLFKKRDLSKVREEGGSKSSILQHHHIKLHQALH